MIPCPPTPGAAPRARNASTSALVVLAALMAPGLAAASPSARLVYARAPEASSCPDEAALRSAVAARLGYDPFFPWAKQTVVVQVWRETGKYRARLQLVDAGGLAHGTRTLASGQTTCAELFDAAALAISIAMDSLPKNDPEPEAASARPRETEPPPPPAAPAPAPPPSPPEPPPQAEPPPPARPPARSPRATGIIGVDLLGALDTEPGPTAGIAAFSGLVFPSASVALEVRGDAPAAANSDTGVGRVRAWSYALTLAPCARLDVASLCALGTVGLLYARADDVTDPRSDRAIFAAVGGRVGVEWPLSSAIALRAHLDAGVELNRAHLLIGGADAWIAPLVALTGGAGVAARFE